MEILSVRIVSIAKFALIIIFFTLFIGVKQTFAIEYTVTFESSKPPGLTTFCSNQSGCRDIGSCWNSEAPGVTDCGRACIIDGVARGSVWTKYSYDDCYETAFDRRTGESLSCTSLYTSVSAVYSTADKCSNGANPPSPSEPYLKGGSCTGSIGNIYKTCCSNTSPSYIINDSRSGMGTNNSCVAIPPFSGAPYPPYDGVCPNPPGSVGSTAIRCTTTGEAGQQPCGQSACGPIV